MIKKIIKLDGINVRLIFPQVHIMKSFGKTYPFKNWYDLLKLIEMWFLAHEVHQIAQYVLEKGYMYYG